MSGVEVISAISAVISIIDASIKIYESAQKDLKLSKTFKAVGNRLPILLNTLQTSSEKILEGYDKKAGKLRQIFEKVLPEEHDAWEKRYVKVVKRFGKGNKVEELMASITEDVQLVVNHHAVKSAKPEQIVELEKIIKEMKSVRSSLPEDNSPGMTFNSQGGAQTNNVNAGSGQQINNNAAVGTQYFGSVTLRTKHDVRFRQPAGLCLGQAPHIDQKLFIGRESEIAQIRELNVTSEATLKDSFRLVAKAIFEVQEAQVLQDEQSLIQTRRWLSNKKNARWLLIFDNYDDPGQYQIEQYYPYVSHEAIIVTTRRPDLVAGSEIRIQPLQSVNESLEILET